MFKQYRANLGNDEVLIETGKLAQQAGGAVTVRLGDSMVLVAATASSKPREGIDFFPLTVDYEERRYAAGKIPGGFFKREGRPTTDAILLCRSIDRPIRPLFPDGYRNDVQIVVTPLSADQEHDIDSIAFIGASAALTISDIPFIGPVGAVKVAYVEGEFVINPTIQQLAESDLDLAIMGTKTSVLMIEAGANQFPEDKMLEAIKLGHDAIQGIIALQETMAAEIGKEKKVEIHTKDTSDVVARVSELAGDAIKEMVGQGLNRDERREAENAILAQLNEKLADEELDKSALSDAFDKIVKQTMRKQVLDTGVRIDGRDINTVRELSAEVGLLPRTHGSALFSRGATQVLNIATLGTAADEQIIETLSGDSHKRYMHHYNFPPYSTGEAYPMRGPRRREIGHGALAERAIIPVLPSAEEFPYTIRTVSECMSSDGSTSMASTCASSLSLLDTGVPIKAPVAGIAMGLITDEDRWTVITDILGLEDHLGDMDFKVTGTEAGITAIQLDIKIAGISMEIIQEAITRARLARLQILQVMNACISEPRSELSVYAPRIQTLRIPVSKIGALIGPGGKNIRSIIDDCGVKIDVEDDGTVFVASTDGKSAEEAIARIQELTAEPEIGRIYTGKVVRVTDFGAFVEFMAGRDGLVHISQLADYRVGRVEDVANVGDEIMVMVIDIDPQGKVKLSRQAVLEGWTAEEARSRDRRPSRPPRSGGRPDRRRSSDRDNR